MGRQVPGDQFLGHLVRALPARDPVAEELHAARAAQNIEVIGIAVDFRDNVLAYAKEVEIDYPLLIGEQDGLDAAAAFGLGSMGFPFTVFTDNQGPHRHRIPRRAAPDQADLILDTFVDVNRWRTQLSKKPRRASRQASKRSAAARAA